MLVHNTYLADEPIAHCSLGKLLGNSHVWVNVHNIRPRANSASSGGSCGCGCCWLTIGRHSPLLLLALGPLLLCKLLLLLLLIAWLRRVLPISIKTSWRLAKLLLWWRIACIGHQGMCMQVSCCSLLTVYSITQWWV